jgi:hypothetical protein
MGPKVPVQPEFLSGWKQIADYLGMGVRTVQRYEREQGLPIHRTAGKSVGAVISTKAELDGWVASGRVRSDSVPGRWPAEQTNKLGAEFLQIDSEFALTFSGLALEASDKEKRRRATQAARKAYDTIMRLRKGIKLTDAQRDKLDTNLQRLKSELQSLGERF